MAWSDVELALQNFLESATGLDDAHVIFADQQGDEPSRPFLTIRRTMNGDKGAFDYTVASPTAGTPLPGEEVSLTTYGPREARIRLNAFSTDTVGDTTAMELLEKAKDALNSAPTPDALAAAGICVFDVGDVENLSVLRDADFEGRAQLELRLYLMRQRTIKTGYIDRVQLVNQATGTTRVIP